MKVILEKLFEQYLFCTFSNLTNRSIISSLNHNQMEFADNGYYFYDFIKNGILETRKINKEINWEYIASIKTNNKKDYIFSAKYFRELLLKKYKND